MMDSHPKNSPFPHKLLPIPHILFLKPRSFGFLAGKTVVLVVLFQVFRPSVVYFSLSCTLPWYGDPYRRTKVEDADYCELPIFRRREKLGPAYGETRPRVPCLLILTAGRVVERQPHRWGLILNRVSNMGK